ncbi:basic leucine zipper transcriptional factor ATF-like 3 isoform X2 [Symphalangus syndactylus]|uniref:basic leucine zipper transcriptional factor ATF-like 3 isoform X2 n=1 Tax=Symphalangus syndactylus TaxID=9590 RepID=UPI002441DF00|nr:basic leucine zipper transcriptional factor ATF-like 3 isoform X2 [Symphalangus syndactylus]
MPRWDREKNHRPQNTHCVSQPEFPGSGRRTPKAAWRPPGPHRPGRRLAWVGFAFPPGFQSHHVTSTKRGAPAESRSRGGIWDPESPEDDDRKVRRREKNRVAAQRSRKKQTQKADKLHEVTSYSKMIARAPSIRSTFQANSKRKEKKKKRVSAPHFYRGFSRSLT